ncbi:MAG TPA: sigma-70 family RNA polymerase sigma factor [Candidatus Acidoferrum sp.]|jgi:RNA polymerase sigma factor (TIGR02999 family)|nr:sigma-70 family RNA polymerase sigma factor [Candidatus Acidoferrum sp.]
MSDITLLLDAISRGESRASEDLLPLIYDELRRLAAVRMAGEAAGQTLQPTALVHEAWLKLVNEGGRTWKNRAHFFRAAAQAMRRILVDRARQKMSIKRGSGGEKIAIEEVDLPAATVDDRVLLVDQNLERLEAEDPESARIVTLKFFGGLTNKEVARILGVTERSVERQWAYAKTCLLEMIQTDLQ